MALDQEYASMVPDLNGETNGERLWDAVQRVASMEGTPEEKAETMRQYAAQIRVRSEYSWMYDVGRGTDGRTLFLEHRLQNEFCRHKSAGCCVCRKSRRL